VLPALVVMVVSGVVADCKAFDGGRVGSVTKAQIPKVTACVWVEMVAAVVPKGRTFVVAEMPTSALKVGKAGGGGTVAVEP
jgi:hypothetical protein